MTNIIQIEVQGKDNSQSAMKSADQNVNRLGQSTKRVGEIAGGILAANMFQSLGSAVTGFFKGAVEGARESEKVMATTEAIIKSTGGAAQVSAGQVQELATAISNKTGIDDEAIQTGANLLLTFKNVKNEVGDGANVFDRATAAAVDLSAAGFGSIDSASKMLGKALNDPVAGLTALNRAGVTFTAQQKDQIKAMVESGDVLGAQKVILEEIESQVGGTAEAQATAADKAKVAYGNLQEAVGALLLPALDALATAGAAAAEWLSALPGPVQAVVVGVAALGLGFMLLAPRVVVARAALASMPPALTSFVTKAGAALGVIGLLAAGYQLLQSTSKDFAVGTGEAADALQKLSAGETSELIGRIVELSGAIEGADRWMGIIPTSIDDWGRSAKGNKEIHDEWNASISAVDQALAAMVAGGDIEGAQAQITLLGEQMGLSGDALDEFVNEHLPLYADGLKGAEAAAAGAAAANDELAGSAKNAGDNAEMEAEKLEELAGQATTAAEGILALRDANRSVAEAFDTATATIAENGETVDINTEKGRANQEAVDNLAGAHLTLIQKLIDEKKPTEDVSGAMETMRAQVREAGLAAGMTEEDVEGLITDLLQVPGQYVARVEAAKTKEAQDRVAGVQRFLDNFEGTYTANARALADRTSINNANAAINNAARNRTATIFVRQTGYGGGLSPYAVAHGGISGGGRHAAEGGAQGGVNVLVGEQGPELAELPFGTRVVPAGGTQARMQTVGPGTGYNPRPGSTPGEAGLLLAMNELLKKMQGKGSYYEDFTWKQASGNMMAWNDQIMNLMEQTGFSGKNWDDRGAVAKWLKKQIAIRAEKWTNVEDLPEYEGPSLGGGGGGSGGSGGSGGGGGSTRVILEIRSSGQPMDNWLLEMLRKSVRVRGGDVQLVLGSGRPR